MITTIEVTKTKNPRTSSPSVVNQILIYPAGNRLTLSPEAQQALTEAYEEIAPRHHKRLDTDQWMWTETFAYDSSNNRAAKTNGWG